MAVAVGSRDAPILLDEDEDDDIICLGGPTRLPSKRLTRTTRRHSPEHDSSPSSAAIFTSGGNNHVIVLEDEDKPGTSQTPASVGGMPPISGETLVSSARLETESLKRKRSEDSLQSRVQHGLPLFSSSCEAPVHLGLFAGLNKNQRKRLRNRLRAEEGGTNLAWAARSTTPTPSSVSVPSPIPTCIPGPGHALRVSSVTLPKPVLTPNAFHDQLSTSGLPPRKGGPERSIFTGPSWPRHITKGSQAAIPGPGLGLLAYGDSMPIDPPPALHFPVPGMPPNEYGQHSRIIGKYGCPEPGSGKFLASRDSSISHDPRRTLILERLPKRFRTLDFILQWCRDTALENDPAPLYADVVYKLGKALVEFTTQERADRAFNSPRLTNEDGRTQIRAFWFRPDYSVPPASVSLPHRPSRELSSVSSTIAPPIGIPVEPRSSVSSQPIQTPPSDVKSSAAGPSLFAPDPIHLPPVTAKSASIVEPTHHSESEPPSRCSVASQSVGLHGGNSEDCSDTQVEGNAGEFAASGVRQTGSPELSSWPMVQEDSALDLKIQAREVSPSPTDQEVVILQDDVEMQDEDQRQQKASGYEDSDILIVSSVSISSPEEVTILLEEDNDDLLFEREGSPQLMYPFPEDPEPELPFNSDLSTMPGASSPTAPAIPVLGEYLPAYESSPVLADSPKVTSQPILKPTDSCPMTPLRNARKRSADSCNRDGDEESQSAKKKRIKNVKKKRLWCRRSYVTRSRSKSFTKTIIKRKRARLPRSAGKSSSEPSSTSVPAAPSPVVAQGIIQTEEEQSSSQLEQYGLIPSSAAQENGSTADELPAEAIPKSLDDMNTLPSPALSPQNKEKREGSQVPVVDPCPTTLARSSPFPESVAAGIDVARESHSNECETGPQALPVPPSSSDACPAMVSTPKRPASSSNGNEQLLSLSTKKRRRSMDPCKEDRAQGRITRSKGIVRPCSKLVSETYVVMPIIEEEENAPKPDQTDQISIAGSRDKKDDSEGIMDAIGPIVVTDELGSWGSASSPQDKQVKGPRSASANNRVTPECMSGPEAFVAREGQVASEEPKDCSHLQSSPTNHPTTTPSSHTPECSGNISDVDIDPRSSQKKNRECGLESSAGKQSQKLEICVESSKGLAHSEAIDARDVKTSALESVENRSPDLSSANRCASPLALVSHDVILGGEEDSSRSDQDVEKSDVVLADKNDLLPSAELLKNERDKLARSLSPELESLPSFESSTAAVPSTPCPDERVKLIRTSIADTTNGLKVWPVVLEWVIENGRHHPDSIDKDWSAHELADGRRLVRFTRDVPNRRLRISCEVVSPCEVDDNESVVVSCILREETHDFWITSVDIIRLLEGLVGSTFSVEEKNRVRRNMQSLKPLTLSENKPSCGSFYRRVVDFPPPRPVCIKKEVKVFAWSQLVPALNKVLSKYSIVCDSGSSCLLQPESSQSSLEQSARASRNSSEGVRPRGPSKALASLPFLYHNVSKEELVDLRENTFAGKKAVALVTGASSAAPVNSESALVAIAKDSAESGNPGASLAECCASLTSIDSSSSSTGSLFSSEPTMSSVSSAAESALPRSASYVENMAVALLEDILTSLKSGAPSDQAKPVKGTKSAETPSHPVPVGPMLLMLDRQKRLEGHLAKSKTLLAQWEAAQDKSDKTRIMALIKEEKRDFEAGEAAADAELKRTEGMKANTKRSKPKIVSKRYTARRWPQTQYDQLVISLSDNEDNNSASDDDE